MKLLQRIFGNSLLRRLRKDTQGVAYIEFALCLPFLVLLFAGSVDVTRMVLLHQKVDRAVFTVGDLATQLRIEDGACSRVSRWETNVVAAILLPFEYNRADYDFVVSAVIGARPSWAPNGPLRDLIEWRYPRGQSSRIGPFSAPYQQTANLPNPISGLDSDERVIVTEMVYRFRPLLRVWSGLSAERFRKVSYFRSRISTGDESRGSGVLSGC